MELDDEILVWTVCFLIISVVTNIIFLFYEPHETMILSCDLVTKNISNCDISMTVNGETVYFNSTYDIVIEGGLND